MKILRNIIAWISSFFRKSTQVTVKNSRLRKQARPLTKKEKREAWFMSFGYSYEPKYRKVPTWI
jgi:hypothetical protein